MTPMVVPVDVPPDRVEMLVPAYTWSGDDGMNVVFADVGEPLAALPPVEEQDWYGHGPAVLVDLGDRWGWVDLSEDHRHYTWIASYADANAGRYWGVLEFTVEGPAWEIPIVFTVDGGRTWRVVEVPKPHYFAAFDDLVVDDRGHGVLVVKDQDLGVHVYRTRDFGAHWTRPRRYPVVNALNRAEDAVEWRCGFNYLHRPEGPPAEECRLPKEVLEAIRDGARDG